MPSTSFLCLGTDVRVRVKFLENGMIEAGGGGCLELPATQLRPWYVLLAVPPAIAELYFTWCVVA